MLKLVWEDKKKTNKKEKMETSKIILLSIIILTYIFSFFVCFMVYVEKDLSPLTYLIPSIFTLSTTSLGFYSWKAKTENKLKIEIQKIKEEQKLKTKFNDKSIKIDLKDENNNTVENYGIYNDFSNNDDYGGLG